MSLILRLISRTGLCCRSIDLSFSLRRAFPKIIHIVIGTAADSGIVFCKKPSAAAAKLASSYRSQLPIKGDVNNGLDSLKLGIPNSILPPCAKAMAVSGRGIFAINH